MLTMGILRASYILWFYKYADYQYFFNLTKMYSGFRRGPLRPRGILADSHEKLLACHAQMSDK